MQKEMTFNTANEDTYFIYLFIIKSYTKYSKKNIKTEKENTTVNCEQLLYNCEQANFYRLLNIDLIGCMLIIACQCQIQMLPHCATQLSCVVFVVELGECNVK